MPLGDSEPQKDGSLSNRLLRSLQVQEHLHHDIPRSHWYSGSHEIRCLWCYWWFPLPTSFSAYSRYYHDLRGGCRCERCEFALSGSSRARNRHVLPYWYYFTFSPESLLADAMSMSVSDYMSSTAEMEVEVTRLFDLSSLIIVSNSQGGVSKIWRQHRSYWSNSLHLERTWIQIRWGIDSRAHYCAKQRIFDRSASCVSSSSILSLIIPPLNSGFWRGIISIQ